MWRNPCWFSCRSGCCKTLQEPLEAVVSRAQSWRWMDPVTLEAVVIRAQSWRWMNPVVVAATGGSDQSSSRRRRTTLRRMSVPVKCNCTRVVMMLMQWVTVACWATMYCEYDYSELLACVLLGSVFICISYVRDRPRATKARDASVCVLSEALTILTRDMFNKPFLLDLCFVVRFAHCNLCFRRRERRRRRRRRRQREVVRRNGWEKQGED